MENILTEFPAVSSKVFHYNIDIPKNCNTFLENSSILKFSLQLKIIISSTGILLSSSANKLNVFIFSN